MKLKGMVYVRDLNGRTSRQPTGTAAICTFLTPFIAIRATARRDSAHNIPSLVPISQTIQLIFI